MTTPAHENLSQRRPVAVGDHAPDFTALSFTGESIRLSERLAKGPVVLFFYPKDDSLICTAEACAFRDSYEAFAAAGTEVIGVSGGDDEAQRRFSAKNHLPFLLIPDPEGALQRLYGVRKVLGVIPSRVTYVIERGGVVRQVFESQLDAKKHVAEALKTLQGG